MPQKHGGQSSPSSPYLGATKTAGKENCSLCMVERIDLFNGFQKQNSKSSKTHNLLNARKEIYLSCNFWTWFLRLRAVGNEGTAEAKRWLKRRWERERESRMPICFPDRVRITEQKGQALTLSELEKKEHYMWKPKTLRGFLAYVSMYMCIL